MLGTIAIFVLAEAMVRLEFMFTGFLPAPTEIVRALFLRYKPPSTGRQSSKHFRVGH